MDVVHRQRAASLLFVTVVVAVCADTWDAIVHGAAIPRAPPRAPRQHGNEAVDALLAGSETYFSGVLRMNKDVFIQLCNELHERDLLRSTTAVSLFQQVAIFLVAVGRALDFRMLAHDFGHSTRTIHK